MSSRRNSQLAPLAILLLAMVCAISAAAQQGNLPPTASATKVPPQESPVPPAAATSPQIKNVPDDSANTRLPFMAESNREGHEDTPSAAGLLLRTLGALLLIVGLIVAAAWGLKRFGGARFGAPKEDAPALVVLNSISLGEKRSLAIVRFGQRTLLVGSTAQSVTLLAETELEGLTPEVRTVADILSGATPGAFAAELSTASNRLVRPDQIGGAESE